MPEVPLIVRGGQAVPPVEVERILLSHPGVAEAAVIGLPDPFWDEIVAAAVRMSAPLTAPAVDLTAYCRERLAPYKVPVRWLFVSEMPRDPAGEICRVTLGAQLAVVSPHAGAPWSAQLPTGVSGGDGSAPATAVLGGLRPRLAIDDLWIPRQVRRSGALEDLDHL
jgi:hypothetical protein